MALIILFPLSLTALPQKLLQKFTKSLVGKKIVIIVEGKAVSVPVLRDPITSGRIAVFSDKDTILKIEKELNKKKE